MPRPTFKGLDDMKSGAAFRLLPGMQKPQLPPPSTAAATTTTPTASDDDVESRFSEYFGRKVASAGLRKSGRDAKHGFVFKSGPYKNRTYDEAAVQSRADFDLGGQTGEDSRFPRLDAMKTGAAFRMLPKKPQLPPAVGMTTMDKAREFRNSLPMRQPEAASNAAVGDYFNRNPKAFGVASGAGGRTTVGNVPRKPLLPAMASTDELRRKRPLM